MPPSQIFYPRRNGLFSVLLLATVCSITPPAYSASAGMIKASKGAASIERNNKSMPALVGASVESGDRVITGADGAVGITLRDNTVLSAGPDSNLVLDKFAFDPQSRKGALVTTLNKGTLAAISGTLARSSPETVTFKTSSMTLGVRGTEFVIEAAGE